MKINLNATIDTEDFAHFSEQDAKELILDIDSSRASVDFTLDIIKSLVNSLIEGSDITKEEIIKEIL